MAKRNAAEWRLITTYVIRTFNVKGIAVLALIEF